MTSWEPYVRNECEQTAAREFAKLLADDYRQLLAVVPIVIDRLAQWGIAFDQTESRDD